MPRESSGDGPEAAAAIADLVSWLGNRTVESGGTNHGSIALPFQGWQKFKEAFTPEIVVRAITESKNPVERVLDPFGGSGTTGLTAQFLGIQPTLVEVNPYLADVIEAKLSNYDVAALSTSVRDYLARLPNLDDVDEWTTLPSTFIEPGVGDRWLFSSALSGLLRGAILSTEDYDETTSRFLRVCIGGTLVSLSNARVNGKGRRYRGGWASKEKSPAEALGAIQKRIGAALEDVVTFGTRAETRFEVVRGDARSALDDITGMDLCVFSPPYPNSFDYTDVYNIELWMLGYLADKNANRELRESTLSSHVQLGRDFSPPPTGSATLDGVLTDLDSARDRLWSSHIPEMVGGSFHDIVQVVQKSKAALEPNGEIWAVVGDSQYAGTVVPVAEILAELGELVDMDVRLETLRSMRTSPQQGGRHELPESLVIFS